jgi:uncharacterized protein (DUF58 family)
MLTVRAKPYAEYFGFGSAETPARSHDVSPYYTHRGFFQPIGILLILGAALAFGMVSFDGPRHFEAAVFISLGALMALNYRRTRSQAEGLSLSRTAPAVCRETDEIEVLVEVSNRGRHPVEDLVLIDRFSGSALSVRTAESPGPIHPGENRRIRYRTRCDGGMGRQRFGPLTALVTDPLGVFEFQVSEDEPLEIKVRGAAEPIPPLPVRSSASSFTYGAYQTAQAGSSEIFRGIREYHRGDSLRHICWKLSSRHQNLLVKEFERSANADVSIVLNMDAEAHVGLKTQSTWHYAKRAALSVAAQQLWAGNSVQLVAKGLDVPFGKGRQHESLLTAALSDAAPLVDPRAPHILDGIASRVPPGSTLIYVTPVHGQDFAKRIEQLLRLRVFDLQILCVLVEIDPFILATWLMDQSDSAPFVMPPLERSLNGQRLLSARHRLAAAGIPAYVLRKDLPLSKSFLNAGRES